MYSLNHHYHNETHLKEWINKHGLEEKEQCLVQFFCGTPKEQRLEEITSLLSLMLPKAHIVGTTTDGEIMADAVHTHSTIISCTVFEKSDVISTGMAYEEDCFTLGHNLARELEHDDNRAMILFTTGLQINGEEFLNGVHNVVKGRYVVAGGMAGDNAKFKGTYVSCAQSVYAKGAVGVVIRSKVLQARTKYQFGWKPVGLPMRVTKSDKNRVYEINGMPAVAIYEKYLGKQVSKNLPKVGIEFPLIMTRNGVDLGRACLSKYDDGSMLFAGDIKEGEEVRFGIGDIDTIVDESRAICDDTERLFHPESIFIYSCMARRRLLKNDCSFELRRISRYCTISGFYTYGEFYGTHEESSFMNQTMTLLALSESTQTSINIPVVEDEIDKFEPNKMGVALMHLTNTIASEWEERLKKEIAKNKEQERRIFQQNKLVQMGDMVKMIAHQWRQPLNALSAAAINLSFLSRMEMLDKEKVEESSRFIQDQCQKMSHTINTFLDFVKPHKEPKKFLLSHTITSVLEIIGVQLQNHHIKVSVTSSEETLSLVGHEELLEEIIISLLTNAKDAFDAMDIPGKEIRITVESRAGVPVISVEDNAGGIPADVAEKVFNPFFSTKEEGKGKGLDLYMSLEIMRKKFNGDLHYIPKKGGSRFELVCGKEI